MAEFTLERITKHPSWTFSKLKDGAGKLICYIIEDQHRDAAEDKVKGETAIDEGRYRISFIDGEKRHSNLFNKMRENRRNKWNMRLLPVIEEEVGGERCGRHTYVRVHTGKDAGSSYGCPITAAKVGDNGKANGTSDAGFKAFHDVLLPYYESGEECWITVK